MHLSLQLPQSIDSSRIYKDSINREALGSQECTLCTQNKEGLVCTSYLSGKEVAFKWLQKQQQLSFLDMMGLLLDECSFVVAGSAYLLG